MSREKVRQEGIETVTLASVERSKPSEVDMAVDTLKPPKRQRRSVLQDEAAAVVDELEMDEWKTLVERRVGRAVGRLATLAKENEELDERRRQLAEEQDDIVNFLRASGWSWAKISRELGISPQAVHAQYAKKAEKA